MLRLLSRILLAIAALFALRVLFASARRASLRGDASNRTVGSRPRRTTLDGSGRPPRIDRAAAEDVPFVEVEPEPSRRG